MNCFNQKYIERSASPSK